MFMCKGDIAVTSHGILGKGTNKDFRFTIRIQRAFDIEQ